MKKILLTLGFSALSLMTASACTAKASGSSADTQTTAEATASAEAAPEAKASAVRHIDAAFLRANIYDYKEHPN